MMMTYKYRPLTTFITALSCTILHTTALHAATAHCTTAEGFNDTQFMSAASIDQLNDKNLGTGGSGTGTSGSGIGGTGLEDEKGIGGTGEKMTSAAPIYISGTIHAFGSICVNGVRVTYDNDTQITSNDNATQLSEADLRIGQVVSMIANNYKSLKGQNTIKAQRISVDYALSGHITHIDKQASTLSIDGQTVKIFNETALNTLKIGNVIRVSGMRNTDGKLIASYVEALPHDTNLSKWTSTRQSKAIPSNAKKVSIQGFVSELDMQNGKAKINNHYVELDNNTKDLRLGSRVIISGHRRPDGLIHAKRWIEQGDLMRRPVIKDRIKHKNKEAPKKPQYNSENDRIKDRSPHDMRKEQTAQSNFTKPMLNTPEINKPQIDKPLIKEKISIPKPDISDVKSIQDRIHTEIDKHKNCPPKL